MLSDYVRQTPICLYLNSSDSRYVVSLRIAAHVCRSEETREKYDRID